MNAPPWTSPTRTQATWFWVRSRGLIAIRGWRNLRQSGVRRWIRNDALAAAPIRVQLRVPLWTDGRADEFALVAGKVHNLRVAIRAFDGIEIAAGERLSFWQQLGRPSVRRGYVVGREIRAGCVVPTIAGGICQISNALATAASRAGFELVERHAHSAHIELADVRQEQVDATVFWNYVDLQIRATQAWRLELSLTASELVLTIRAREISSSSPPLRQRIPITIKAESEVAEAPMPAPVARGCLTCEEVSCFRHQPQTRGDQARSAWLLDGWTPEFHAWLSKQEGAADRLSPVSPQQLPRWLLQRRCIPKNWTALPVAAGSRVEHFGWVSARRAWWLRRHARDAGKRQASVIDGQRWLAQAYAHGLRPEHTHLVIDQGLLPHLQQLGVLGGRSYDVLAGALPMDEIQRRLDLATRQYPANGMADATLTDFRADPAVVRAEIVAMSGARRLLTAHAEVALHWRQRTGLEVLQLPWVLPQLSTSRMRRTADLSALVVFPASALARKGAHELAAALQGLHCRLRVLGSASGDAMMWHGVAVEYGSYADDWLSCADVVVLPAHVEHAPRALLMALAAGIPVIATPACGVPGVECVPANDVQALRKALSAVLACMNDGNETLPEHEDKPLSQPNFPPQPPNAAPTRP